MLVGDPFFLTTFLHPTICHQLTKQSSIFSLPFSQEWYQGYSDSMTGDNKPWPWSPGVAGGWWCAGGGAGNKCLTNDPNFYGPDNYANMASWMNAMAIYNNYAYNNLVILEFQIGVGTYNRGVISFNQNFQVVQGSYNVTWHFTP